MEIYLAKTQGFCAGVTFAIAIVEKAIEKYGAPLYVFHEIVHNTFVVNDFRRRGVIFINDISEANEDKRIIFSAHGVPPSLINEVKEKNLEFIDATCPLVTKVHKEAVKFSKGKYEIILIGHKGHQELIGTSGYVDPEFLHIVENEQDIDKLNLCPGARTAFITQTTLSVDDTKNMICKLKKKFKGIISPSRSDLCYATQNRQDAVKELATMCDVIIICGSTNSSNSNRLRETGEKEGIPSHIIDSVDEFDMATLQGKNKIGISSGASVPRFIVDGLVDGIKNAYPETVVHSFENPEKKISFPLPEI